MAEYEVPESTCTARWASDNAAHAAGDLCGRPAVESIGDSDVCEHHRKRALTWFYNYRLKLPRVRQQQLEEAQIEAATQARLAAEARSIVYYLRRHSDGMIKIGFSASYPGRLTSLRGEHGELSLLLAYAGGRKEENQAHKIWAAARITARREWFRPELPLLLGILRLRNASRARQNRLPEQVPITEIRALIKETRAKLAAPESADWRYQPSSRVTWSLVTQAERETAPLAG